LYEVENQLENYVVRCFYLQKCYLRPPDELLPELLPLLLPELPEEEPEELGGGLLTEELRLGCDTEPELLLLLLLGCETLPGLLRTGC